MKNHSVLLLCFSLFALRAYAQEPKVQPVTSPPPVKTVAADDRAQLEATKDSKSRVRKTIELAELHLKQAEERTAEVQYDMASAELGKYQALVEDLLRFLSTFSQDSNKTRDLYKRLELALRAHGPRLTSLRRSTPLEYAIWIKQIEEFARSGRTEALNSFYGHTVVRDGQQKPVNLKPPEKQSKDGESPPQNKEP
ncbi:MAG TPA: hypothetical protein VJ124_25505 [Pyrinomonadaceae bacterium]|nr:hypothetical protein [Pyrinomonadaceae bacterium]